MQQCNGLSTFASRNESPGLGEVCREQLPWAKPVSRETYHLVLAGPGGADLCLHHGGTGTHTVQLCEEPQAPAKSGPGGCAFAASWSLEQQQQGRNFPACTMAKLALSSLGAEMAHTTIWATSKGMKRSCYGAGKLLQQPALTLCCSHREALVWVPPAMSSALARCPLYLKRKRRRERKSCSIVLLQVEKGWTNSNQTQNRNSSQAETFSCQVWALGGFLQLSNKLLKQRLRAWLAPGF